MICTWFNHWTTVLIEEHISTHTKVILTIKNIKGIDIFFGGQPFDLKVSYLPRDYDSIYAIENPERSRKLKRDFALVFQQIDDFLNKESASKKDEIVFTFGKRRYTVVTKVLIITK